MKINPGNGNSTPVSATCSCARETPMMHTGLDLGLNNCKISGVSLAYPSGLIVNGSKRLYTLEKIIHVYTI